MSSASKGGWLNGKTSMIGTVTALYVIGRFFGAIIAVMVGDLLGRKETIFIGASILAVGAIMHITALSAPAMIVGRIIVGTGNDINTSSAPHWQSETSEASWRGNLVDLKHCWIFQIESGYMWVFIRWRSRLMEIPACVPIHLHLPSSWNCSLTFRVPSLAHCTL